MAGVQASGSGGPHVPSGCSARSSGGIDASTLELQCQQFSVDGLESTTGSSDASGQRRFVEFCTQLGKLGPNGSPCLVDEWKLCLFVTHLAQSVRPSTIKVYLSAIRALHIEQGFSDPLVNCLRLQRVLRSINCSLGDSASTRHLVTDSNLLMKL